MFCRPNRVDAAAIGDHRGILHRYTGKQGRGTAARRAAEAGGFPIIAVAIEVLAHLPQRFCVAAAGIRPRQNGAVLVIEGVDTVEVYDIAVTLTAEMKPAGNERR